MYAVEASAISDVCRVLVSHNGLADIIEVIQQKVEDVQLNDQVDVIISEWMGFYLLHESMLSSVLFARDKFLKSDGIILPATASLHICPVSLRDYYNETFNFWQDVYGFDFSPVVPAVQQRSLSEPLIKELELKNCIAESELITHLDLLYIGQDELLNITGSFSFKSNANTVMHGFACWFDVEFEANGAETVTLSTGPQAPPTHWKQTTVMLPHPLLISKGEEIECQLSITQSKDSPRRYTISIAMPEDDDSSEDLEFEMDQNASELLMNAMHNHTLNLHK